MNTLPVRLLKAKGGSSSFLPPVLLGTTHILSLLLPVPSDSLHSEKHLHLFSEFPEFVPQMHLHFLTRHGGTCSQRVPTDSEDSVLLCSHPFSLQRSQPLSSRGIKSDLIIPKGGRTAPLELRAGYEHTGLDFQLEITILLSSRKDTNPHLTVPFICGREKCLISAEQSLNPPGIWENE